MTLRATLVLGALAIGAAIVTFQLKYQVVMAEREHARIVRQIDAETWRIRSLRADFANLALPSRVALQAKQLGMEQMTVSRVVNIDQLGMAEHLRMSGKVFMVEIEPGTQPVAISFRPLIQPSLLPKEKGR